MESFCSCKNVSAPDVDCPKAESCAFHHTIPGFIFTLKGVGSWHVPSFSIGSFLAVSFKLFYLRAPICKACFLKTCILPYNIYLQHSPNQIYSEVSPVELNEASCLLSVLQIAILDASSALFIPLFTFGCGADDTMPFNVITHQIKTMIHLPPR